MFSKQNRLNSEEFLVFFKKGKKINFANITIVTNPHQSFKTSVVVGKKVSKLAFKRNLLKRRVFGVLKKFYDLKKPTGVLIVILKPGFGKLSRKEAESQLTKAFAEVFKNK